MASLREIEGDTYHQFNLASVFSYVACVTQTGIAPNMQISDFCMSGRLVSELLSEASEEFCP
jgi:hypothetical protein